MRDIQGLLRFFFSPHGRISRGHIWVIYLIPMLILSLIGSAMDTVLGGMLGTSGTPVSWLLNAFYLWPQFAVQIKRYHDIGMTGWLTLAFLVLTLGALFVIFRPVFGLPPAEIEALQALSQTDPEAFAETIAENYITPQTGPAFLLLAFVFVAQFILLYCLPGRTGDNKYGPDPLAV